MWTMNTSCLMHAPGSVTIGALARGQPAARSATQVRVSFFPKLFLLSKFYRRTQYVASV